MIKKRYELAIVYGSTTLQLAQKLAKRIEKFASDGYPIVAKIVDSEHIKDDAISLHEAVERYFKDAVYAFVLVGKDDVAVRQDLFDQKVQQSTTLSTPQAVIKELSNLLVARSGQNAMVEYGYLWHKLGVDNVKILTTFYHSDLENGKFAIPTDIAQDLYHRNINVENPEKDFDDLIKHFVTDFHITSNKDYLHDTRYLVNYSYMFTDAERRDIDGERNFNSQFSKITDLWKNEVNSLARNDERLMFILERIVFISCFPVSYQLVWYEVAMNTLGNMTDDDKLVCRLLNIVKDYTQDMGNRVDNKSVYLDYASTLLELRDDIDARPNSFNALVKIVLQNYLGLAYNASYRWASIYDRDKTWLVNASVALWECIGIAKSAGNVSNLWHGFTYFNIARVCRSICEIDKQGFAEDILQLLHSRGVVDVSKHLVGDWKATYQKAFSKRKLWLEENTFSNFPRALKLSLQLEAIHAQLEYHENSVVEKIDFPVTEFTALKTTFENLVVQVEGINLGEGLKKRFKEYEKRYQT